MTLLMLEPFGLSSSKPSLKRKSLRQAQGERSERKSNRVLKSFIAVFVVALTACASGPKPADWQLNAKSAMERAVAAYLEGNSRVEAAELARARLEISSTGRVDLMARAELLVCASRVASLVFEPCAGFEKLRQDAPPASQAYADYLAGKLQPQAVNLLPKEQQISAQAAISRAQPAIENIADPLAKLVAAGTTFQSGAASPALLQAAVDAASSQGWRRPLLAWLGVQLKLAEASGNSLEAARLQRRITLALKP